MLLSFQLNKKHKIIKIKKRDLSIRNEALGYWKAKGGKPSDLV